MTAHLSETEEEAVEDQLCEDFHDALERGETSFYFCHNHELKRLPDEVKILKPNLTVLHIDNCYQLSSLPPSIGNLTSLTWLNLSYNNLEALPSEIGKLRHLERLHVNNNRLSELPHEIWNLKQLQELQADTNHIKALPSGVLEMRSLRTLFVHNNPLLRPDDVADEASMKLNAPQPPPAGDCDQSRCRFRECFVHVSFHTICDVPQVPVVHYLASQQLLEQKRAVCEERLQEEAQRHIGNRGFKHGLENPEQSERQNNCSPRQRTRFALSRTYFSDTK
ncbi:Plant intracellular Ras-group-related LRR protein 5 [Diplonema papillatum]|nr:Plant intracellular Ras-group-related LRR protein 5 [Diplonema papillatum]